MSKDQKALVTQIEELLVVSSQTRWRGLASLIMAREYAVNGMVDEARYCIAEARSDIRVVRRGA